MLSGGRGPTQRGGDYGDQSQGDGGGGRGRGRRGRGRGDQRPESAQQASSLTSVSEVEIVKTKPITKDKDVQQQPQAQKQQPQQPQPQPGQQQPRPQYQQQQQQQWSNQPQQQQPPSQPQQWAKQPQVQPSQQQQRPQSQPQPQQPVSSQPQQSVLIPEEPSVPSTPLPQAQSEGQASAIPSGETSPRSNTVRVLNGEFPAKRGKGTLGQPIKLRANHFPIDFTKSFTVYQYDVDLVKLLLEGGDRPIKNKAIMREMFLILCDTLLPSGYKNKIVYNFSKNLYSLKKLPFDQSITYDIQIDGSNFQLKLKTINEVTVDPAKYDDQVSISVLDLIFTQKFNYSCINLNRSFFHTNCDYFALGIGLELWKGAYASVRPSEVGLTWNLDCANAAFTKAENVLDLAAQHYDCNYYELGNAIKNDRNGSSFLEQFGNREFKTTTSGFRKKIFNFGPDANYQFDWVKGNISKRVTIKDYIKEKYNIVLKYPNLPCIKSKNNDDASDRNDYFPMEICIQTEYKHRKKLNKSETAEMIKQTAVSALDRMEYVNRWINSSGIKNDPILNEFKIEVKLSMIELDGRVLDSPDVQYSQQFVARGIGTKGQWDHRNFRFNETLPVKRWIILNFARSNRYNLENFAFMLSKIGKIHGVDIKPCLDFRSEQITDDRMVASIFEEIIKKYSPLDLVVVVLPGTTSAYKVIKTLGDINYGITTQAVEDRNVQKINGQLASNIILKINSKLGGKNFILSDKGALFMKYLKDPFQGPMMIFGADVTHPGPGDDKLTESLAAVVGSLDKECSYYAARIYAQKTPEGQAYELIHDLDKMVLSLIRENFKRNNTFPKKIVFFRDGVSEGQFSLILRHEINKIRAACQTLSQGYKPAITFVIVQKRHHTRLFPMRQEDQHGKAQNVPPGTVVDEKIVTQSMIDYFLNSHSGIQGTSRPCRYFVLHDDNNFTMDQIQLLSHYLCHIYSRCPRSVSYPAPAYYAHLAAFRARDYNRTPRQSTGLVTSYEIELHQNIKNKMFFC